MKSVIKKIAILFCLFVVNQHITAQNRYVVFFSDKNGTSFNPLEYFDSKAIERRVKQNLPLCDSTDFPLNSHYVNIVAQLSDSVTSQLRWFNALGIIASEKKMHQIEQLPFVRKVARWTISTSTAEHPFNRNLKKRQMELLANQLNSMEASEFEKSGLNGAGVRIAIFDTGFPTVDKSPVFEHLRKNNRIIRTYDFAKEREFVYDFLPHGTAVLSCIAGKLGNSRVGMATEAEFLLARTEIRSETYSEEENWLQAMEWADKHGADIINSSLGYTYHRYFTEQMDGKTSLVAQAATLAAKKGMLVINAMGNDGINDWKILCTPADVDSVISVGAISSATGYHAYYSSFGPAADYDTKPDVCAFGNVIAAGEYGFEDMSGTSFSTPLVTGFAACVWQKNPTLNNMEIKELIKKSATLYPYFDYAHGYGIPQASRILLPDSVSKEISETFSFSEESGFLIVNIANEIFKPTKSFVYNYLYYHVKNSEGYLSKYAVVEVNEQKIQLLNLNDWSDEEKITVHFAGCTKTFKIKK